MKDDHFKELVRLVELDYERTSQFITGVVGTGVAFRGWAVTIWLAVLGIAFERSVWQLGIVASVVAVIFLLLDGYHAWLLTEAQAHAQNLERFSAAYHDWLARGNEDPDAAEDLRFSMESYEFGVYRNLLRFRVRDLRHVQQGIVFRAFYPFLIIVGVVAALFIGLNPPENAAGDEEKGQEAYVPEPRNERAKAIGTVAAAIAAPLASAGANLLFDSLAGAATESVGDLRRFALDNVAAPFARKVSEGLGDLLLDKINELTATTPQGGTGEDEFRRSVSNALVGPLTKELSAPPLAEALRRAGVSPKDLAHVMASRLASALSSQVFRSVGSALRRSFDDRQLAELRILVSVIADQTASALSPRVPRPARCFGRKATVLGSPAPDELVGTERPDVIAGRQGVDEIRGRGGNDTICGGPGRDSVRGGRTGKDRLFGGRGRDKLRGGSGRDTVRGGPGRDRLFGSAGTDAVFGGRGRDVCDMSLRDRHSRQCENR
jgi:hypothetical protein